MRKLIGNLVARDGAEEAVARGAGGIFLADNILTGSALTGSVRAGSPIAIVYSGDVYSGENFARAAIAEIVGAIPGFGVLDCGIRAAQAASEGARRT
jgi:hypothetical protein